MSEIIMKVFNSMARGLIVYWTVCDSCSHRVMIKEGRLLKHYDGHMLGASPKIERVCQNSGRLIYEQLDSVRFEGNVFIGKDCTLSLDFGRTK